MVGSIINSVKITAYELASKLPISLKPNYSFKACKIREAPGSSVYYFAVALSISAYAGGAAQTCII